MHPVDDDRQAEATKGRQLFSKQPRQQQEQCYQVSAMHEKWQWQQTKHAQNLVSSTSYRDYGNSKPHDIINRLVA